MDRNTAYEELVSRVENKNLIKHSIAVEAIMIKLAEHLHEDIHMWGLAGLLHDIDYDKVNGDMHRHGMAGAEILEGLNLDPTVIYAVKAHNPSLGLVRRRKIDKALYCSDPLSGLITACALILPEKKLAGIDNEFVIKRFHEKSFARGANREQILTCGEIGLSLEEFVEIGLSAMKEIHHALDL